MFSSFCLQLVIQGGTWFCLWAFLVQFAFALAWRARMQSDTQGLGCFTLCLFPVARSWYKDTRGWNPLESKLLEFVLASLFQAAFTPALSSSNPEIQDFDIASESICLPEKCFLVLTPLNHQRILQGIWKLQFLATRRGSRKAATCASNCAIFDLWGCMTWYDSTVNSLIYVEVVFSWFFKYGRLWQVQCIGVASPSFTATRGKLWHISKWWGRLPRVLQSPKHFETCWKSNGAALA